MKQKNRQLINGLPRRILLMLLDCGLIVFCYYLAILLRFDGEDSIVPAAVLRAEVIRAMAPMLPYVLVIYMVVFLVLAACMRSCGSMPACGTLPA